MPEAGKPFKSTKLYDVAAALPLVALYGWAVAKDWPGLKAGFAALGEEGGAEVVAGAAGRALSLVFAGLVIVLVLVRTVPVRKSTGILPRAVALLGAGGGAAILLLPAARLPIVLDLAAIVIVFAGLAGTIASLIWLWRSFSILPEARQLVTSGPYRIVRHPVYAFEEIALFGVMLQFVQPWAFLLFVLQFGFQLARMHLEERVLEDAFPRYADYAARTPRLVPGFC